MRGYKLGRNRQCSIPACRNRGNSYLFTNRTALNDAVCLCGECLEEMYAIYMKLAYPESAIEEVPVEEPDKEALLDETSGAIEEIPEDKIPEEAPVEKPAKKTGGKSK